MAKLVFGLNQSLDGEEFYDRMADYYHLIFEDWDASMRRQGAAIAKLLPPPDKAGPILDIACGIGTQSLALAAHGYAVTGSDVSAGHLLWRQGKPTHRLPDLGLARRACPNLRATSAGVRSKPSVQP
jgi:SAM-dependent methyltransferase